MSIFYMGRNTAEFQKSTLIHQQPLVEAMYKNFKLPFSLSAIVNIIT